MIEMEPWRERLTPSISRYREGGKVGRSVIDSSMVIINATESMMVYAIFAIVKRLAGVYLFNGRDCSMKRVRDKGTKVLCSYINNCEANMSIKM